MTRPCLQALLEEAFKQADANGSGLVTYEVLQEVLMKCDMELNDQAPNPGPKPNT